MDQPYEQTIIDLEDRDPSFLELCPTGKVPLLVDGDAKIYESRVIGDYLVERFTGWDAYPGDARARARQRLAMTRWDECFSRAFFKSLKNGEIDEALRREVEAELYEFEATLCLLPTRSQQDDDSAASPAPALAMASADCMLGYHVAPFWARMKWLGDSSPVTAMLATSPTLGPWLDATLGLPGIAETLPDRDETVARYRRRFIG